MMSYVDLILSRSFETIHIALFILSSISIYLFTGWIYSAYFSPLSSYPGPKLWAASHVVPSFFQLRGDLVYQIAELHRTYGDVVRVGPHAISYIDGNAWTDIYAKTKPQLPKDPKIGPPPPEGVKGLAFAESDDAHARMRRNLSPGFSLKALSDQERLLTRYFDLWIKKMRERSKTGPIDMVAYLDFVTIDVIGELTFGRSFDCLDAADLHPWMGNIYKFLKAFIVMGILFRFQPMGWILKTLVKRIPAFAEKEKLHRGFINERLAARLSRKEENVDSEDSKRARTDFMTFVQRHTGTPSGMSRLELEETCNALMLGGSETTSSALSSAIYNLLKNPSVFIELQGEVRSAFTSDDEITISSTNGLKYLHCVLLEAMRILPPLPSQITRITTPEGNTICERFVPGGTSVTVSHYSAYTSPRNFYLPHNFIPSRFYPSTHPSHPSNSASNPDPGFLQDNRNRIFQPFSTGPRNCIGVNLAWAEMHMLLAKLIWRFDMQLRPESENWEAGMKVWAVWQKRPLMVSLKDIRE